MRVHFIYFTKVISLTFYYIIHLKKNKVAVSIQKINCYQISSKTENLY